MIRDFAAPVLVMLLGAFMLSGTMLSHDISWYLISTRWWLDGLPIYEEIFELNPPLAFYLTAVPVWISGLLGVSATSTYMGFVFVLIAASLLMTRALLRRSATISAPLRHTFLGVAAIGLILLPIRDFGQRDHLFAMFFLPFFAMSLLENPPNRTWRAAIATWAVLGVALKHYFLLLPLLILIYKIITSRSLRPILRVEFIFPVVLLVAYVGASYILHPAYFNSVIPRTFQIYGAYDTPLSDVLTRAKPVLWVLSIALVLLALIRSKDPATVLPIIVGGGAVAVYVLQSKGWNYHRIPANLYVVLAVAWIAARLMRERQHWWPIVPAVLAIGLLLVPALRVGPYNNIFSIRAAPFFSCPPGKRSFQAFSSKVSVGFPLANLAQAEPANRAPALWLFPGATYLLSQTSDPKEQEQYRAIQRDARSMVLNDFFRARPQLVIVDVNTEKAYFNGAKFDYLSYFQENDAFAVAWRAYHHQGKVGTYDIYTRKGC